MPSPASVASPLARSSKPVSKACAMEIRSSSGVWNAWAGASPMVHLVAYLEKQKINFESLTEKVETVSPAGRLVFEVFAALAEFERNLIRERTVAGLAAAAPAAAPAASRQSSHPKRSGRSAPCSDRPKSPSPRSPPASISPGQPSTAPSSNPLLDSTNPPDTGSGP